jgi:hypothetical protein
MVSSQAGGIRNPCRQDGDRSRTAEEDGQSQLCGWPLDVGNVRQGTGVVKQVFPYARIELISTAMPMRITRSTTRMPCISVHTFMEG